MGTKVGVRVGGRVGVGVGVRVRVEVKSRRMTVKPGARPLVTAWDQEAFTHQVRRSEMYCRGLPMARQVCIILGIWQGPPGRGLRSREREDVRFMDTPGGRMSGPSLEHLHVTSRA